MNHEGRFRASRSPGGEEGDVPQIFVVGGEVTNTMRFHHSNVGSIGDQQTVLPPKFHRVEGLYGRHVQERITTHALDRWRWAWLRCQRQNGIYFDNVTLGYVTLSEAKGLVPGKMELPAGQERDSSSLRSSE